MKADFELDFHYLSLLHRTQSISIIFYSNLCVSIILNYLFPIIFPLTQADTEVKEEEKKPEEEPWTQVKADFELEKIGVSLYRGTNDLVSQFACYAVLNQFIGGNLTLDTSAKKYYGSIAQ